VNGGPVGKTRDENKQHKNSKSTCNTNKQTNKQTKEEAGTINYLLIFTCPGLQS